MVGAGKGNDQPRGVDAVAAKFVLKQDAATTTRSSGSKLVKWRGRLRDGPPPVGLGAIDLPSGRLVARDPQRSALGTNTDSEPESQRTVINRPSTAMTTPPRVTVPTVSDSTSTRSPTSTMSTSSAGWRSCNGE